MSIYEDILTRMSNDELLEEYDNFCVACFEDPNDIGHSSTKYSIECELQRRMSK